MSCLQYTSATLLLRLGVTPTVAVGHAVEEEPGRVAAAVLDEGHVVTGFDAQHGEQLHPLAGEGALATHTVRQLFGHRQLPVPVRFPPGVEVNLNRSKHSQVSPGRRNVYVNQVIF